MILRKWPYGCMGKILCLLQWFRVRVSYTTYFFISACIWAHGMQGIKVKCSRKCVILTIVDISAADVEIK